MQHYLFHFDTLASVQLLNDTFYITRDLPSFLSSQWRKTIKSGIPFTIKMCSTETTIGLPLFVDFIIMASS